MSQILGPQGIEDFRVRSLVADRAIEIERSSVLASGAQATIGIKVAAGKLFILESFGAVFETNQDGAMELEIFSDDGHTPGADLPPINRSLGSPVAEGVAASSAAVLSGSETLLIDGVLVGRGSNTDYYAVAAGKGVVLRLTNLDPSSGTLEINIAGTVLDV